MNSILQRKYPSDRIYATAKNFNLKTSGSIKNHKAEKQTFPIRNSTNGFLFENGSIRIALEVVWNILRESY